ncbi:MAG: hypothetical protein VB119_12930 [Candidatus Metalachnospira sp.]|nr:hypothetical protein [Candidatus Metalachnospira sp.]
MERILLDKEYHTGITVIIFVEGTIIKPKSWLSVYNHNSYIPIGNSVRIIETWQGQGANIIYCTSRRKKQAKNIAVLLKRFGFSGVFLAVREQKEKYKDIIEALKPDVLIEDDCKSIGGAWQMCITKVKPEIRKNILSIVVPEFGGIDHLPLDIKELTSSSEK